MEIIPSFHGGEKYCSLTIALNNNVLFKLNNPFFGKSHSTFFTVLGSIDGAVVGAVPTDVRFRESQRCSWKSSGLRTKEQ